MARPPNRQKTKSLEVSVPQSTYEYLGYLATHTMLGASENAVASYLLTRRLNKMLRARFHETQIPMANTSDEP